MKILLIGLAMVVLGAIFGNPVPWALFKYTEYHDLARVIGMVSAFVFLGGFVVMIFAAGYSNAQANKSERELRKTLDRYRR